MTSDDRARSRDADDLFVEAALRELCGRRPVPDPARLLDADPSDRAAAAKRLDAATRRERTTPARRWWWGAAAAVLATAAILWSLAATRDAGAAAPTVWSLFAGDVESATHGGSGAPLPSREFRAHLERFHLVMPRRPTALRDQALRRRIAKVALPVLHRIDDFLERRGGLEPGGRQCQCEFRIYALVLGCEQTRRRVHELAAHHPEAADLLAATAGLIGAEGAEEREPAVRRLQQLLAFEPAVAVDGITAAARAASLRCIAVAGDLAFGEATALARAAADGATADSLRRIAEWTAKDPRQRLDRPLVVAGTTLGGALVSTDDLRGRVVLVHFWSSTSAACDFLLPLVLEARIAHPEDDLVVLGVACDHDVRSLRAWLDRHPEVRWPQLFDESRPGWHAIASELGVGAVPRVFLIDRRGVLRSIDVDRDLLRRVEDLLAEPR